MHQDFIHRIVSGNRYVYLVLALLFSNVLLYEGQIYAMLGRPAPGFLVASVLGMTVFMVVVSALLALLVSLFVYKQRSFKERYFLLAKFIYLTLLVLFFAFVTIALFVNLYKGRI